MNHETPVKPPCDCDTRPVEIEITNVPPEDYDYREEGDWRFIELPGPE